MKRVQNTKWQCNKKCNQFGKILNCENCDKLFKTVFKNCAVTCFTERQQVSHSATVAQWGEYLYINCVIGAFTAQVWDPPLPPAEASCQDTGLQRCDLWTGQTEHKRDSESKINFYISEQGIIMTLLCIMTMCETLFYQQP